MGRQIALWGLSFKPNTDDVRESPGIAIAQALSDRGATLSIYDPEAMASGALVLGDVGTFVSNAYDALDDADALVLSTEWAEFRSPDTVEMAKRMRGRIVIDGRNALDGQALCEEGFIYVGIGSRTGREW
jgi:UDPglucose 6-dehydrogenase